MSEKARKLLKQDFDRWLDSNGPVALYLVQKLEPIESTRIIYPPTYADIGYNIDTLSDKRTVVTIDSVGSQANRMEPMFKCESSNPDDWLVPQIQIVIRREPCGECEPCKENAKAAGTKGKNKQECSNPQEVTRSLLDLAHRAADAVVQSSPGLLRLIVPAFKALQQGDAGLLCTIAPTSLVFGVWDSRGDTGEKRPRLVRSVIRAWDVEVVHAAAQFNSIWKALDDQQQADLEKEAKAKKAKLSEKGLKDAPAVFRKTKILQYREGAPNPEARVLGGVVVNGEVKREVTINLVALRGLRGKNEHDTKQIQRYLLGLSLIAATADMDLFLREGCLLRYAENGDQWSEVPRRGEPELVALDPNVIRSFTEEEAGHFRSKWPTVFGDKWPNLKYEFDLEEAKKLLAKKTAEEESGEE